ncbi:hypothetical protein Raf01_52910 [Rugosimonospora africana]|uniref:Uncharacterized protein n=1 Tax=Rugosimonospora africana TaxID=556532 RepID=A0A8J3QU31_9ACTN|nr:hypothetical protein Raf01_52910 [Rugosimonospora africana]
MTVAMSTVNPEGSESVVTKRADSVAEYPDPPVAGTAGEAGFVPVAEFVGCAVAGMASPAERSAVRAVAEPHAVTMQAATTATNLRSAIQSTRQTPPLARDA